MVGITTVMMINNINWTINGYLFNKKTLYTVSLQKYDHNKVL
jgi:hypothetical protein